MTLMQIRALKNPPIKEAIISASFKNTVDLEKVNAFCNSEEIKNFYPNKNEALNLLLNVPPDAKKTATTTASQQHIGYILNCEDCNKSIQVKLGQISFHNTNNYIGWNDFFDEFKRIWQIFCRIVGVVDLTQLSVRYINDVVLVPPFDKGFQEYINLLPIIPKGISPTVNNFFLQINIPNSDGTLTGIITESIASAEPRELHLILDINAYKVSNFVCNSDEMWNTLENLRNFKNEMFFNCLTDKTINKYE